MNPRVITAQCHEDHSITLVFTNGERRRFDARPYLNYPAFEHLQSVPYFLQGRASHGTVSWPDEEDFCPDTLYLESVPCEGSPVGDAA